MAKTLTILFILLYACCSMAMESSDQLASGQSAIQSEEHSASAAFLQAIPLVATQFLGIPYRYGQNPRLTGATDNSYLFFSIYTLAAQEAGLFYKGYMPIKYLLGHVKPVPDGAVQNGDLMVLNNHLAAMVYKTEPWGKLHFIYASQKRQQVISFTSDNIVFKVYWMANLKGFYRIQDGLLH